MPEHKKKGVILEKLLYNNEEIYVVDPTGNFDSIQRHAVRQHEIYTYASQKAIEDFNYKSRLEDELDGQEKRKSAQEQYQFEEENCASHPSSNPLKRRRETRIEDETIHSSVPSEGSFDDELGKDNRFAPMVVENGSGDEVVISKHHSLKRRKLNDQARQQKKTTQIEDDDDVFVVKAKSRKLSEQPSLSAAFRSSQLSIEDVPDEEENVNQNHAKKLPEHRHHESQVVDKDESGLETVKPTRVADRRFKPSTPEKNQGIFRTSPSTTPGTNRSRHKSLQELIITPILERREREREQSRQSDLRDESPTGGRQSARRSSVASKDTLLDESLPTTRRSARLSSQSRTSSPFAQLLSQMSNGHQTSPKSSKPDITVMSSSPNPFITNATRVKAGADRLKKGGSKVKKVEKTKSNKQKLHLQAEAARNLTAQEAKEPPAFDPDAEYEIRGLLDDEIRRDKNGNRIRFFQVDWKGPWDPDWQPEDCIDEEVRQAYFRNKMLAASSASSDEADEYDSLGIDGTLERSRIIQDDEGTHSHSGDMKVHLVVGNDDNDVDMGNENVEIEMQMEAPGTAAIKRNLFSSLNDNKSAPSTSLRKASTSHKPNTTTGSTQKTQKHSPKKHSPKKRNNKSIILISESEADQYPAQLFVPEFSTGPEKLKANGPYNAQSPFSKSAGEQQYKVLGSREEERIEGTPVVGELADDEASDLDALVDDDVALD